MNKTDFASASVPRKALYVVMILLVVALLFVAYYFAVPVIQGVFLPEAPPSGWLVRPMYALRCCAAVLLMGFTLPVVAPGLRRLGIFPQPAKKPLHPALWAHAVYGSLLVVVYFVTGVLYFSAYTLVTDQEILIHNPVYPRRYGMNDIAALVEIPRGFRVEADKENGPVLNVYFHDRRRASLSLDCEGLTEQDLAGIRGMLAARTGKAWEQDPRAEPRKP
jgi:hypothetical protein